MKHFLNEFMKFAMKGNVLDLAIGVIIGSAFGKIVSSLVADVITPLLGIVLGNVKINALHLGPVTIGNFLQATIDFVIVAFMIFLFVHATTIIRKRYEKPVVPPTPMPPKTTREVELLVEIRDLLKQEKV